MLRFIFHFVIAFGIAVLALEKGQAATPLRVTAAPIGPASDTVDQTLRVRIEAFDAHGSLMAISTNVILSGYTFGNSGMVISEITDRGETIEFTNAGETPVDLTDWNLEAGISAVESGRSVQQRIQGPAVIPPGGTILWTSRTNYPSGFPVLVSSRRFNAPQALSIIEIRNNMGALVDQVLFTSPNSNPQHLWQGTSLSMPGDTTLAQVRTGSRNHNSRADWSIGKRSPGMLNPGLSVPWIGNRSPIGVSPSSVTLTNGIWEGVVTLPETPARHCTIAADDGSGSRFESPFVELPKLAPLILEYAEGFEVTSEAQAGSVLKLRVSLPSSELAAADLPVQLSFDHPGEFSGPGFVTLAAHRASIEFSITNLDDTLPDGRAVVNLKASAAGYASTELTLVNDDNESGKILVSLPVRANENAGFLQQRGRVFLGVPSLHPVEVTLSALGRIQVPAKLIIPAGKLSADFPIRILDDDVHNTGTVPDRVTATVVGWPSAVAGMTISDDEPEDFEVILPSTVLEGQTASGTLSIGSPHDQDVRLNLTATSDALVLPAEIVVPAGVKEVSFSFLARDNAFHTGPVAITVYVSSASGTLARTRLAIIDDEFVPFRMQLGFDSAVFDGSPGSVSISVSDSFGYDPSTNAPVALDLLTNGELANLALSSREVETTNGIFFGLIAFEGEALGATLAASSLGLTATSGPVDVLRGITLESTTINDVSAWPGRSNFLYLETVGTSPSESNQLVEYDPVLRSSVRTLDLPQFASRLAVSDDGTVGWLASEFNSLQRIDLKNWRFDREVSLPATDFTLKAAALAIAPGTTDDLAVFVYPTGSSSPFTRRLFGYRNGLQSGQAFEFDSGGLNPSLTPGRRPGEFYASHDNIVSRVSFHDGVLAMDNQRELTGNQASLYSSPALVSERLVLGNGRALDSDTLEELAGYDTDGFPPKAMGAFIPGHDSFLFLDLNYHVQVFDASNHTLKGTHRLPLNAMSGDPNRVIPWGDRGVAFLGWTGRKLSFFESPLLTSATTDLRLSIDGPTNITYPPAEAPFFVTWVFTVTNAGPAISHQTRLVLNAGSPVELGSLAPGSIATYTNTAFASAGTMFVGAQVSSDLVDSAPGNNTASLTTVALPAAPASQTNLFLDAAAMAVDPTRQRIYVAAGPRSSMPGIEIIDPSHGVVVAGIPYATNTTRLAVSLDGNRLYSLRGANRIVAIDLRNLQPEFDLVLTNHTVTSFAMLEDGSGRWVVGTDNGVMIFHDAELQVTTEIPDWDNWTVGAKGNRLWMISNLRFLRGFESKTNGFIDILQKHLSSLPGNEYSFLAEDQRLFFPNAVYDIASDRLLANPITNFRLIPSGTSAYGYTGVALQRFDQGTLALLSEEPVPALMPFQIIDSARWSEDGFAFLGMNGILTLVHSSLVPLASGDIAVTLTSPPAIYSGQQAVWEINVVNLGTSPARLPHLSISQSGLSNLRLDVDQFASAYELNAYFSTLAPGESAKVRLTALVIGNSVTLTAKVRAQVEDTAPFNNENNWSGTSILFPGSIGISLQAQDRVQAGSLFDIVCTLSNAGATTLRSVGLVLDRHPGLEVVTTDAGILSSAWNDNPYIKEAVPVLGPGSSTTVRLTVRETIPGVVPVAVRLANFIENADPRFGVGLKMIQVETPGRLDDSKPPFNLPFDQVVWSPARQQWIARAGNSVCFLAPVTLHVEGSVLYPYNGSTLYPTTDGHFAWVALDGGEAVRISLDNGQTDIHCLPKRGLAQGNSALSIVPGEPGSVVMAHLDSTGHPYVAIYDHGAARPTDYYADLASGGQGLGVTVATDRRVFVTTGYLLRELSITPNGLEFFSNLDAVNPNAETVLAVAGGLLIRGRGQAIDLATLSSITIPWAQNEFVDDICYGLDSVFDQPQDIYAYDAARRTVLWRLPMDFLSNGIFSLATAGTKGVLMTGPRGGWVPTPTNTDVDLQLAASLDTPVLGAGQEFPVHMDVAKAGAWTALNSRLIVQYSVGVEMTGPASTTNGGSISLGHIYSPTNFTLAFRAKAPGPQSINLRIESDFTDPYPADNTAALSWNTPVNPVLLLGDLVTSNAGKPIPFRLSTAAPTDLDIDFLAEVLSGRPTAVATPTFKVHFPRGASEATAQFLTPNTQPANEESVRISVNQSPIEITQPTALITITNGVFAQVQPRTMDVSEGNEGTLYVNVPLILLQAVPYPVDIGYQALGLSAQAGSDFVPLAGRVVFQPGQRTNVVTVAISGDRDFEPNESLFLDLSAINGVTFENGFPLINILNDDPPPPPALSFRISGGDSGIISITGLTGAKYSLQTRTNLAQGTWQTLGNPVSGKGAVLDFSIPIEADPKRFYRILAN